MFIICFMTAYFTAAEKYKDGLIECDKKIFSAFHHRTCAHTVRRLPRRALRNRSHRLGKQHSKPSSSITIWVPCRRSGARRFQASGRGSTRRTRSSHSPSTPAAERGNGFDKELIDYLINENVPATLFINSRWIDANPETFLYLAENSLFEVENHGVAHRPLSVTGRSAYGIDGTRGVFGVIGEVLPNADKILSLTGRRPLFFRSGTDYYDEVAVLIAAGLGETTVGYSVLGDAGATYSAAQIKAACLSAKPGDIVICHMNHPEKDTAEGIMQAVPALRAEGFRFVKLEEYGLK